MNGKDKNVNGMRIIDHKLKMVLLKAHALTRKKLGKDLHMYPPLITYEEVGLCFQHPLLTDARKMEILFLDFDGFRLAHKFKDMTAAEFYEAITGKDPARK
jgi:hypothetical protein